MSVSKAEAIIRCLTEENIDLWTLRELALTEGGLLNNFIRRRAWPRLLSLDRYSTSKSDSDTRLERKLNNDSNDKEGEDANTNSEQHVLLTSSRSSSSSETPLDELDNGNEFSNLTEDEIDQVQRDVIRCTWHLLTRDQKLLWNRIDRFDDDDNKDAGDDNKHKQHDAHAADDDSISSSKNDICANDEDNISTKTSTKSQKEKDELMCQLRRQQEKLGLLIKTVLQDASGSLKYYQGYHDISSIFLSVLEPDGLNMTKRVLLRLSQSHFRDQMSDTFHEITCALRLIIYPLLDVVDKPLHDYLSSAGMMEPFFALSWIITWFSHDLKDTKVATRLFDAFLVSHPVLPFYITLATITHPVNRQTIMNTECEFSALHTVLRNLPKNICSRLSRSCRNYDDKENQHRTAQEDINGHLPTQQIDLKVPVQDLINMAIGYMRRVPPRSIVHVATKYSSRNCNSLDPYLEAVNSIMFFQDPPSWALVSTVPSDWVLAQNSISNTKTSTRPKPVATPNDDKKVLREKKSKGLVLMEIIEEDGDVNMNSEVFNSNNPNARTASGMVGDLSFKRRVRVAKILLVSGIAVVALYSLSSYYLDTKSKTEPTCNLNPDAENSSTCPAGTSANVKPLRWLPQKSIIVPDFGRWLNKSSSTTFSCSADTASKIACLEERNHSPFFGWSSTKCRNTQIPSSCPTTEMDIKVIAEVGLKVQNRPLHHLSVVRKVAISPLKAMRKVRPRFTWLQSSIKEGMQNMVQILQKEFSSHNQTVLPAIPFD